MIAVMQATLAFDVYGTLIDPMGIVDALSPFVGNDAEAFAVAWRAKQVEYLFRRGLGRRYEPFSVCTEQSLRYTASVFGRELKPADRERLLARYRSLPAYPGAGEALDRLAAAGFMNYAFSNGGPDDLEPLLANAGLSRRFRGIVSVRETRSYKPDPAVYAFFLENTGAMPGSTWLVSANAFDIIGAREVGWKAVWVRRDERQVFDPWDIEPTAIVRELDELIEVLV